jgi:hypothetical protein
MLNKLLFTTETKTKATRDPFTASRRLQQKRWTDNNKQWPGSGAVVLLVLSREMETYVHTKTYIQMFTTANKQKPIDGLKNEWSSGTRYSMDKMWRHYAASKKPITRKEDC